MALISELFTKPFNQQLKDCAERNPAHISQTDNNQGEHVARIQMALLLLAPGEPDLAVFTNTKEFEADFKAKKYGKATADAVLKYKQKRVIIARSRQDQADNIVGIETIDKLDKEMKNLEGKGKGGGVNPVKDNSIKVATLWLNAFIGRDVKNADGSPHSFTIGKGQHQGATAIPGPASLIIPTFDDCYLTDQRSFDANNPTASSRIHAEVTIDFTKDVPEMKQPGTFGATFDTIRVRKSTGEELNRGRGIARGGFTAVGGFTPKSKRVTVRYKLAGSNPIAKAPSFPIFVPTPFGPVPIPPTPKKTDPQTPVDPDIDMVGEFTLDAELRKLTFRGLIDGFPFYEGYIRVDGITHTLYQVPPPPGMTPANGLLGPPTIAVAKDLSIP